MASTFYKSPSGNFVNTQYADSSLQGGKVYSEADAGITPAAPTSQPSGSSALYYPINNNSISSAVLNGQVDPQQFDSYLSSSILNQYKGLYSDGSNKAYNAFSANGASAAAQVKAALEGQSFNYGGQNYQFSNGQPIKTSTTVNQSTTSGAGTTSSQSAGNTYQYITTDGRTATVQAATPQAAITSAPNIAASSGVQLISSNALPQATASSTASGVTNSSTVQIPNIQQTAPGNNSAIDGMLSYYKSLFDTSNQQAQDYQTKLAAAQQNQQDQSGGFLSKVLGSKSPSQVSADAFSQTGINPTQYFAQEKASIAEIGSLNDQYNNLVAQRDEQVNAATDMTETSGFINNRIAQINRNYSPELNQLSANINSKAATLQASQGMFTEAQNFVKQAVDAATADANYNMQLFKTFYDINQSTINNLDTKYQNALKASSDAAEKAFTLQYNEQNQVGQLLMANPKAGIQIGDSLVTAMQKVATNPTVLAAQTEVIDVGGKKLLINSSDGSVIKNYGGGSATPSGYKFTSTQLNTGAAKSGMTLSAFRALSPDVQNFFVSTSPTKIKPMVDAINAGTATTEMIDASNLSQPVKDYFKSKITTSGGGGIWSTIKSWLGGIAFPQG